jgi:penicillin-insensitive murein endopeptidase
LSLAALLATAGAEADTAANAWSRIAAPSAGPALAIGSTANGCLAGGARLPLDGPGYSVVRPSRGRYWGHPDLIGFIADLGAAAHQAGLKRLLIGDMAQPRGGPLPFGHKSHQTGLDADIWFTFGQDAPPQTTEREAPTFPSMLRPGGSAIDPRRFGAQQSRLLALAAADPRVDRIFVNPTIKLALCRGEAAVGRDRAWLHRLSPWWGHDDHFHVRLRCPATSPDCEAQRPVPPGDGCDAALEDWTHHQTPPAPPAHPPAPRPMPEACTALLER